MIFEFDDEQGDSWQLLADHELVRVGDRCTFTARASESPSDIMATNAIVRLENGDPALGGQGPFLIGGTVASGRKAAENEGYPHAQIYRRKEKLIVTEEQLRKIIIQK